MIMDSLVIEKFLNAKMIIAGITQLAAGYAVAKRKPKKYSGFLFIDSAVPKCEIHLFITSGKVLFIHFDHLVMKLSFATLCL